MLPVTRYVLRITISPSPLVTIFFYCIGFEIILNFAAIILWKDLIDCNHGKKC